MKTLYSLLFAALLVLPATAFAQEECVPGGNRVSVTVLDPADIAGDYPANAPIGNGDTPFADTTGLLPPGTTGNVVIARSPGGTVHSGNTSLPDQGCEELTNAAEMEGNIALIPRGICEFGLKALNAQNAGAIGWILYNPAGSAEGDDGILAGFIGGGTYGGEVTTPGAFVSHNTGEAIRSRLEDFEVPVEVNMQYRECYMPPVAAEENVIPGTRELSAARPNPFANRTQFDLALDRAQQVSVNVYNVLGQRVATLHEGALSASTHTFSFEASTLPAGVYLVRAVGENFAQTRQVTLVR